MFWILVNKKTCCELHRPVLAEVTQSAMSFSLDEVPSLLPNKVMPKNSEIVGEYDVRCPMAEREGLNKVE